MSTPDIPWILKLRDHIQNNKERYLQSAFEGGRPGECGCLVHHTIEIHDDLEPAYVWDYSTRAEQDSHRAWGEGECLLQEKLGLSRREVIELSACTWYIPGHGYHTPTPKQVVDLLTGMAEGNSMWKEFGKICDGMEEKEA